MEGAVELCTLGYEGAEIAGFIAALTAAGVATVLDVRAVPHSRKPDFAKTRLERHLAAAGIGYRHLAGLGNPKPGRQAAAAGDLAGYRRIFRAQLDSAAGRAGLAEAARLARAGRACLLCLEADPARCHRGLVAERLAAAHGFRLRHLGIDDQHRLEL